MSGVPIYYMKVFLVIETARISFSRDGWYISTIHPNDINAQAQTDNHLRADIMFTFFRKRAAAMGQRKITTFRMNVLEYKQIGQTN